MLDILLLTENMPFTIAITIAILIGIFELVALMVGVGGMVDGLTGDLDLSPDVDGFSFLDYLCIGKVPFLIWLVIALMSFGAVGIAIQSLIPLSYWIAIPIALIVAIIPTRIISMFIYRNMPKDETTAIYSTEFIGYVATIVIGEARRGYPAQAKFADIHKQTHYVMVEPLNDKAILKAGDTVSLYEKQGNVFLVTPANSTVF